MKISNDTIGNRTRDISACSAETLPIALQHFVDPEDSLPHLQVPATCPYPEPHQSSRCPHPTP